MSIVSSLTWAARKVDAAALAQARRFAAALDFDVLIDSQDKLMVRTPSGDVIEYGLESSDTPDYLFRGQDTVLGFLVENLDATADALAAAGFEPLSDITDGGGVRFQHFAGPDGLAYGLIQPLSD